MTSRLDMIPFSKSPPGPVSTAIFISFSIHFISISISKFYLLYIYDINIVNNFLAIIASFMLNSFYFKNYVLATIFLTYKNKSKWNTFKKND